MARVSEKVKAYTKGKTKPGWDGTESLKDLLFDIHVAHKSWGNGWYELVRLHLYDDAKIMLAVHGKGECLSKALDIIDELIERGDD